VQGLKLTNGSYEGHVNSTVTRKPNEQLTRKKRTISDALSSGIENISARSLGVGASGHRGEADNQQVVNIPALWSRQRVY
jgi:hypothetical protein